MENLKNYSVKCPNDYATNSKWKAYIDYHNEKYGYRWKGNVIGAYYGRLRLNIDNPENYEKIITLDEAYEMLIDKPDNYIVEKKILTPYQKLKMVNFKQCKAEDAAYFEKYGRQPISMVRELDKKTSLVWVEDQDKIHLFIDGKVFDEYTIDQTIINLEKLN